MDDLICYLLMISFPQICDWMDDQGLDYSTEAVVTNFEPKVMECNDDLSLQCALPNWQQTHFDCRLAMF